MSTKEDIQKILDEKSFRYERKYSAEEIKANSIEFSEPKEYEGTVYLIARANDGIEYWFIEYEDGWKVDHTWGSFLLTKSTTAGK